PAPPATVVFLLGATAVYAGRSSLTSRSFAAVDDVRWQRGPIAGEDEPEKAGNADRVSPGGVRDREKPDACDEEGNGEPCVQPGARQLSMLESACGLARGLLAPTELTAQRQPKEERKRGEEQQGTGEDHDEEG